MNNTQKVVEEKKPLRLDLGCGKNKREGFIGVDSRQFDGVDQVVNLAERNVEGEREAALYRAGKVAGEPVYSWAPFTPWPWGDASVEEIHASHVIEHFTAPERIHVVNEMHRVLIPGGKATIITPYWSSCRAYGDLTHQWPPVSEMWFLYLNKAWRDGNAPHNDAYTCDFDHVCAPFSLHPALLAKNTEYQQHAATFWKEAVLDLVATLTKR